MNASAVCEEQVQVRRERRPCGGPSGITLGQLLTRAHEGVLASGTAECPVCEGVLARSGGDAECTNCGSRLA
jgi:hypothetical protein